MADTGVDTTFLELAAVANDIVREMRVRSDAAGLAVPLTQNQSQIMSCVHNAPGCSPSQIATSTGLQRANVSTALRELRDRGLIESVPDETDRRVQRVYATALADETLAALRAGWAAVLEQAWDGDPEVLARTTQTLSALRDRLTAVSAPADAPLPTPR